MRQCKELAVIKGSSLRTFGSLGSIFAISMSICFGIASWEL
jgi:hypothetical protein